MNRTIMMGKMANDTWILTIVERYHGTARGVE